MKPYFETESGQLYHGDCLEIMPHLESVDLILTDPPWGVSLVRGYSELTRTKIAGDEQAPDVRWMANHKAIVWGGNNFCDQLPKSTGWLVWHKYVPDYAPNSQAELAWSNVVRGVRHFSRHYTGFSCASDGGKKHPAQKPIALMIWCMGLAKIDGVVCDPYLGSGTTAIACERLNRRWIGIEIEEKYCEIAAKRIDGLKFGLGQIEKGKEKEGLLY